MNGTKFLMLSLIASAVALGATVGSTQAQGVGKPAATAGDAKAGRETYMKVGCYECHGYSGHGGEVAPKLTPGLLPLEAFNHVVRNPRSAMPRYSPNVLTDGEVADIHAYLVSRPKPRPAQDIPILRGLLGPQGGAR